MTETITSRLEALEEERTKLEAEARTRRADLLEELKTICKLAGPINADLLDGIVAPRKRGPKAGARKARKPRAKAETQPEVTA